MEVPTGNNSINVTESETKPEPAREIPSGLDLFYALHNSMEIEEILKKDQLPKNGQTDCQKR